MVTTILGLLATIAGVISFHCGLREGSVFSHTVPLLALFLLLLLGGVLLCVSIARQNVKSKLTQLALCDSLTGAPSMEKFRRDASAMIHRYGADKYLVLYIDTRHFRYFNKDFGYETGDRYLVHVAESLKQMVEPNEAFARVSGDMFVMLYRRRDSSDFAVEHWEKLRERIMNFPAVTESHYALRLNCGVYELTRELDNIQTALDRADLARKSLKDAYDTDIAIHSVDMQTQQDMEKEIEQLMHTALEKGEFTPYMQPKYNLESGRVVGAEALVRWIKPDGTIIPPDEFIPLFEKNGFIQKLDIYMLESVCRRMRELIDRGVMPVQTSINQSRCYMYSPNYVESLCAIVNKYQIPPHLIEFEITENIAYRNTDKLIAVIAKLSANGFLMSLDDFGSGFSSLNVLKDLRVDVLKLDRVFLGESIDTERGKTVIANIIRMAKELKIEVVAEGVETGEQVDFLRSSNCDMAQGYYFSRPIPMQDFEMLLRQQTKEAVVL